MMTTGGRRARRGAVLWTALVLPAGLVCPFAHAGAQPVATPPVARHGELLATASAVVRTVPALGRVWPGYWPAGRPFVLADSGHAALLYTTGAAPAGFLPVPGGPGVPGPPGRAYLYEGAVPGLSASQGLMDLDYAVPGGQAIAVPLGEGLAPTLRFLFHEAFHAYQQRAFTRPHVLDVEAPADDVSDSANVALWEVERRILREALAADDEAALRPLLRGYLAVRGRRAGRLRPDVARYEAELERIEGSAEWVGRMGALAAEDRDPAELADGLREDLARPVRVPRFATGAHWVIRLRVYATGAALAALLERLDPDWRADLASGETLVALIAAEAGADAWDSAALAEAALARFGESPAPRSILP
jgi:hypothetical protein